MIILLICFTTIVLMIAWVFRPFKLASKRFVIKITHNPASDWKAYRGHAHPALWFDLPPLFINQIDDTYASGDTVEEVHEAVKKKLTALKHFQEEPVKFIVVQNEYGGLD